MKKKDLIYDFIRKKVLEDNMYSEGIDTALISKNLHMQRSNVSAILNELVREKKLLKSNTRPVKYKVNDNIQKDIFTDVIGATESLEKAITLAKAAILYPSGSLGMKILAFPGVGTSFFIKRIIQYAKQQNILANDAPYIRINCKQFSSIRDIENCLFDSSGFGCWQSAKEGVLLIEHYEELSNDQLLKLADLLEKNTDIKLRICVGTLKECPINMPIDIILPTYSERSFFERLELIEYFFSKEALSSNKSIVVSDNVLKSLLLARYERNIKELKEVIVMACANAYVRSVHGGDNVYVHSNDLPQHISASLIQERNFRDEINKVLGNTTTRIYSSEGNYFKIQKEKNLYLQIDDNYQNLEKQGINEREIKQSINDHIQKLFNKYNYTGFKSFSKGKDELAKIVPEPIIRMVIGWIKVTEHELGRSFDNNIFYGLCLHLNSMINLNVGQVKFSEDKISFFKNKYPKEYTETIKLGQVIFQRFKYQCTESELIGILMFLAEPQHEKASYPVLLYAMHGNGVARHLSYLVNDLSHESNAYYYDMQLSKNTDDALKELIELIQKINQGAGVIVIYDMGSFKVMFDKIAEQTNIKLRLIQLPVSLIGLEIARKCVNDSDIDNIYHTVTQNLTSFEKGNSVEQELIITLCHTGEGGAIQLKDYIDQYSKLGIAVKAMNESDRNKLAKEVFELQKFYKIRAFVGTFDPKLYGIPFISMKTLFEVSHENLDKILMFSPVNGTAYVYDQIYNHFEETFTYTSISKLKKVIPVVINKIEQRYQLTEDQQIGLVTHLGSLIEKILSKESYDKEQNYRSICQKYPDDFKYLCKCVRVVEQEFEIILTDEMISTLVVIVKRV